MQVCTSLQTDNHATTPLLSFLRAGCPSSQQCQSTEEGDHNLRQLAVCGSHVKRPLETYLPVLGCVGVYVCVCPHARESRIPALHCSQYLVTVDTEQKPPVSVLPELLVLSL